MTLLGFISLTTPILLGGLALLALPIMAHALHRHSQRRIVFPTIRLLQKSVASQSRLFRLRRWILLALRCLMVALVVMAFTRPVWFDVSAAQSATKQTNSVVLLLDASASTSQRAGNISLFQSLRSEANRTLDGLGSDDYANVVVADAQPRLLLPRMTRNLPAVRDELGRLTGTFERADLPRAIALAGEALREIDSQPRLVILSDLQQTNWNDVLQADVSKLLPPGTRVTVVVPTRAEVDNVSLSQPRFFPTQPLAEQPTQLIVRAANYSQQPKQTRATLKLNDQPSGEQTITLAAGEERDLAFDPVTIAAGEHLVELTIAEDGLPVDDRAFLVVKTVNRLPVLIISDDTPADVGSASYFLQRALAPQGDKLDRFAVRHMTPSAVTAADLEASNAVFLGYVSELSAATATLFRKYVEQGGGMLLFCGEGSAARTLQVLDNNSGADGFLPWQPGTARGAGVLDEALRITGGKWQSRMLADFDEQSQIAMAQIRFQRTWTVGALRPSAQVLLTFSDGSPALGLRQAGLGQLLVANFSPALETSDLAKYGSFVALVQSLAKQLRPATSAIKPPVVGDPLRLMETISDGVQAGSMTLLGPDRSELTFTTAVDNGQLMLMLAHTDKPGFYEFRRGQQRQAVAAINVDPREGDLHRIEHAKLTSHFEQGGLSPEFQKSEGWKPVLNTAGRPFWGSCVAAAMCVVAVELFLVGLWRR